MASTKTGVTKMTVAQKRNEEVKSGKLQMQILLDKYKEQISRALPSVLTPERFARMCMTALSANPQLCLCTPLSFLGAVLNAAQLGLEPNTPLGEAYLIPYKNNKKGGVYECQFQLGYKGLMSLAWRSGEIKSIEAHEVRENDLFEYEYGLNPNCRHVPARKDRGKVIFYYAIYHTVSGGYGFEVASKEDIIQFAQDKSKAFNNGPWQTDFDAMAKKTVLKAALKYAPLKSEFQRQVASDSTIKNNIADDMTLVPDETPRDEETPTIDTEAADVNQIPEHTAPSEMAMPEMDAMPADMFAGVPADK